MMMSDQYETQFPLYLMHKDLQMVTESAESVGISMPITSTTKQQFQSAKQDDLGDDDFSAIYRWYQQQ